MAQTIEIKSRGVNAMNAIGWVTFDFWRQEEAEKLEADLQAEYPGKYRLEKHIRPNPDFSLAQKTFRYKPFFTLWFGVKRGAV